jgi:putative lipoic acid-binding regulatory protein
MELQESPIEYPCEFPIKVMGLSQEGFIKAVIEVVSRHDPQFRPATIEQRKSSQGRYVSLTCTVHATSRAQLDALYQELCDHPAVAHVL